MSNELDVRVGDVVRLKPMTVEKIWYNFCDVKVVGLCGGMMACFEADIESIISRAETDAEKIARLEADLAKAPRRIEWSGGECPVGGKVVVWFRDSTTMSAGAEGFSWKHHSSARDIIAYMELPE